MRGIHLATACAVVLSIAGPAACGLQSQGLLAADAGALPAVNVPVPEAAAAAADDATGIEIPAPTDDDSGTSSDDAAVEPGDGAPALAGDSAAPMDSEAAAPFSCTACATKMCPSQVAACGPGSECIEYRDCDEACTIDGNKSCSATCSSMYPGGSTALSDLAICDIGCGGACVAGVTLGTP